MKAAVIAKDERPLVLFDGECGLCSASIQFILRRERRPYFRFAPLQGQAAAAVRHRHPWLEGVDSLVVVDRGRALMRSAAALQIAGHLRWPWPLARAAWIIPRPLRDALYDVVARHRHRLIPSAPFRPPTGLADRFLD
ncbi:MAG: DUF393 domain-containing protein [Gemmatimonadales bacterium]